MVGQAESVLLETSMRTPSYAFLPFFLLRLESQVWTRQGLVSLDIKIALFSALPLWWKASRLALYPHRNIG